MFSTYDQWKLATPPEYERGDPPEWACRDCAGTGEELPCYANRYRHPICERCGGTGEDPDYAEAMNELADMEARRFAEIDARVDAMIEAEEPIF